SQRQRHRHNRELQAAQADLRAGEITMLQFVAIANRTTRERQRTNAAGVAVALGVSVALSPRSTAARRRGSGRPRFRRVSRSSARGTPSALADEGPHEPPGEPRRRLTHTPTSPEARWSY